jgi:hypothetical protein
LKLITALKGGQNRSQQYVPLDRPATRPSGEPP